MPEPDFFIRYRISYAEFYVGKIPRRGLYVLALPDAAATRVVLE